jgi:predicted RNA-binding Zn ribbon-like protein
MRGLIVNKQTRKVGNESGFPRLLAERFCLDFVNSIEAPLNEAIDSITDYAALIRWGSHTGLYSREHAHTLIALAEKQQDIAQAAYVEALELRTSLTNIFRAIAHHETPRTNDLEALQSLYRHLLNLAVLEREDNHGYHWHWDGNPLQQVTWAIITDALDLLQSDQLARVKQCPGTGDCGWLFFDTSKNQSRQWCSMEGCGSRAKMRRQYARHKQELITDSGDRKNQR